MRRTGCGFTHKVLLVFALALTALIPAGCGLTADKSDFAGPDWSRGKLLGKATINNRPGIAWHPEDRCAILTWLTRTEGQWHFQFVRINDEGQVASSRTLALAPHQPSHPKLLPDSQGGFHLFWLDREREGRPGVYHARITAEGEILSGPQRLSDAESEITGYSVAEAMVGVLDIFWSDVAASIPGLYHARIGTSGEMLLAPRALGADGEHPACAADANGIVHLTWHKTGTEGGEEVFYATFDPQNLHFGESSLIAAFPGGTGVILYPPEIGLDSGHVYIFWSQERRAGGLTPGTAQTYCAIFPIGNPSVYKVVALEIPGSARPEYVPVSGAFNYQHLGYYREVSGEIGVDEEFIRIIRAPGCERLPYGYVVPYHMTVEYTYMPCPIPGQREEVGIVVSSMMALSEHAEGLVQIAFVVLKDGRWKGLEVAGVTRSSSMRPFAVTDDQGAIHLAWLDAAGFGVYDVYYASTSPSVKSALNRITVEDIITSLAGRIWGAVAAFSFFPMLILWLLLPSVWLVLFYFSQPDSDLRIKSGWVGLTVAISLYLLSKLFAVPAFLRYAPLLDVVGPQFEDLIVFGFPLLIAAISLLAMGVYIRRSERKAVLVAFVIFAATDSIISLVLYVPRAVGI
ncbi:MAG: hypothetical protein H5T64_08735 [Chloroflexi bacterium]|nr:hypothetical protein [Chloroflexota bacterium]